MSYQITFRKNADFANDVPRKHPILGPYLVKLMYFSFVACILGGFSESIRTGLFCCLMCKLDITLLRQVYTIVKKTL